MSLTEDPNSPCLKKHRPDGQQVCYLVLSEEERAKGFVRPVRTMYVHLKCGCETSMDLAISETYARDVRFYGGTFCCACGAHFRLMEIVDNRMQWNFEWVPDGDPVGSDAEEATDYLAEKAAKEAAKHAGGGI